MKIKEYLNISQKWTGVVNSELFFANGRTHGALTLIVFGFEVDFSDPSHGKINIVFGWKRDGWDYRELKSRCNYQIHQEGKFSDLIKTLNKLENVTVNIELVEADE